MANPEKARETRIKNQEARSRLYHEQATAVSAARLALQRVFEDENTGPDQVLRAAELLVRLSNR